MVQYGVSRGKKKRKFDQRRLRTSARSVIPFAHIGNLTMTLGQLETSTSDQDCGEGGMAIHANSTPTCFNASKPQTSNCAHYDFYLGLPPVAILDAMPVQEPR